MKYFPRSFNWLRLFRGKAPRAGLVLLLGLFVIIISGLISQQSPSAFSSVTNTAPSARHLFGTDYLGRDLYSQIAWGAFPTLFVALVASLVAVTSGTMSGLLGGYFSKLELPLGSIGDVILTFPPLLILVVVGSIWFPPSNLFISFVLAIVLWPLVNRSIRNQVRSLKSLEYVDAAKISGLTDTKIVMTIMLPEVISIAVAYFIIDLSGAMLLTAAIEFLGLTNSNAISWGSILYWAQQYAFVYHDWWWVLIPGLFIALVSLGFALIGFSIEEFSNPRLR